MDMFHLGPCSAALYLWRWMYLSHEGLDVDVRFLTSCVQPAMEVPGIWPAVSSVLATTRL